MCSILGFCGTAGAEEIEVGTQGRASQPGRTASGVAGFAGTTEIQRALAKTASRGPDESRLLNTGRGWLGFNRLAIMGLTPEGMQPFAYGGKKTLKYEVLPGTGEEGFSKKCERADRMPEGCEVAVVCNGEIYGFRLLKKELMDKGYEFLSDSDCEILPAMYKEYGTEMFRKLDAEYAMVLYDAEKDTYIAARDPIGIRPLYYGITEAGTYVFASEPKNLLNFAKTIKPFPPGHYFADGKFVKYRDMSEVEEVSKEDIETVTQRIHDLLVLGVKKRMDSDTPVGFLLSGGLDSSLVCGIAATMVDKPIRTWAIGMDIDAIDLKYAKEVADYIHSEHTEVIISKDDVLSALETVIEALGTYDITTIRASVGMYLVCKAIHETSDVRVIMTGEISDEIFGYKYTDFAPNAAEFQAEAEKRIREIHMYDVLRADRCISVNSLEARVPFGDLEFVKYCMSIDPEMKMNRYGKGKYLLRKAFEKDGIIPESILWREKAAFSDAVGHSLKDDLTEFAESRYDDEAFEKGIAKYDFAKPFTKESLLYRDIFEKYYPGQAEMVKDFWMPNKSWEGCNVNDPSARVLSNYGASGV